jgi:hypothetical protein
MNGRYTREQCCGRKLELADRGGLPVMLNESRNESVEGSEHYLSNLLGPADAGRQRLEPSRGITTFTRGNRASDGIRVRSRQLPYETLTSAVRANPALTRLP